MPLIHNNKTNRNSDNLDWFYSLFKSFLFTQFGEIMIKLWNGFDSFQEIPYSEMFVWRMNGIAVQSKAHQNTLAFQFFFKKCYNRNASAASLRNGSFSK